MSCQGCSSDGEAREPSCQRVATYGQQLPAKHHLIEEAREQERERDGHCRHERKWPDACLAERADRVGYVIEGRGMGEAVVGGRGQVRSAEGEPVGVDLSHIDDEARNEWGGEV